MKVRFNEKFNCCMQGKPIKDAIMFKDSGQAVICSNDESLSKVGCTSKNNKDLKYLGYTYTHRLDKIENEWWRFLSDVRYIKGGKKVTAKKTATKTQTPKVGDTVRLIEDYDGSGMVGELAVIKGVDGSRFQLEFINDPPAGIGHSCGGLCKDKHGWNVPFRNVELAKRSHKKKEPMVDRSVTPFVVGDVVEFVMKYQSFKIGDRITITRTEDCVDSTEGHKVKQMIYHIVNGKERGIYDFRLKLVKGAKSTTPELVEDPRTFYKVVRIDGAPANGSARSTGFKYTLPVDGPTEWTPTINDISLCNKGYHVIEAKDIKRWVTSEYNGTDTLVCECKARGEIKGGDNKYVAQSIQLTKILYRWKDAENTYLKAMKEFEQTANDRAREVNTRAEKEKMQINQECHDAKQVYADKFFAIGR